MLTLEFSMNAFVLIAIVVASACVGFVFRNIQITKSRFRIFQLENELINSHAEILELQRDFISLEMKMHATKEPILVMKNVLKTDGAEKLPDVSLRKKLLGVENNATKKEIYPLPYKTLLSKEA
jgi:hypothetical protein